MPGAHIYQILNHYTSPRDLDPGFGVLDNSVNERPDWFEYWPIRKFLQHEPLEDGAFYGFLSPKFKIKTNLTASMVQEFVRDAGGGADVILLSPSIHNSAYFWNVFEHGESEHPGLLAVARQFFERIERRADLDELVSDSRNTVHSNYFLAKPRFWREWLRVNEALFALAEDPSDGLGARLRAPTAYRGRSDVQMKIFLMERVATWLLAGESGFVARVRDPFAAPRRVYKLPVAIVCDALKIAYATQGRGQYKDVFQLVRGARKFLNLQIRVGAFMGLKGVRLYTRRLGAYWDQSEQ
jgi:hypothetical protein